MSKVERICRYIIFALAVALTLPFFAAAADDDITESTTEYIKNNFDLAQQAGNVHYDWMTFSMALLGEAPENALAELENRLPEKDTSVPTNLHRIALTVSALNGEPTDFAERDLISESVFYCGNLGRQGVNGYIWALILLDSENYQIPDNSSITRQGLIQSILNNRLENGSFGLNGKAPDTDITAMAITALAPYIDLETIYGDITVKQAIDSALEWLSATQKADGDFASWGTENCESTAQVIIALCSLGIDIQRDERFIKNDHSPLDGLMKYYAGGGFAHIIEGGEKKAHPLATGQALCALVAIDRATEGKGLFQLSAEANQTEPTRDEAAPSASAPTDSSESSFNAAAERSEKDNIEIKYIILGIILALALIILTAVWIKTRKARDILIIALVFVLIATFIAISEFQTVEEYYNENPQAVTDSTDKVTLSINCISALGSGAAERLIEEGYIPEDGRITAPSEYVLCEGDSVFDIVRRAVQSNRIQFEYTGIDSIYIEGISYLYEFDCGAASGWMYSVNGVNPNYGISQYYPENGDSIEIYYVIDYE